MDDKYFKKRRKQEISTLEDEIYDYIMGNTCKYKSNLYFWRNKGVYDNYNKYYKHTIEHRDVNKRIFNIYFFINNLKLYMINTFLFYIVLKSISFHIVY